MGKKSAGRPAGPEWPKGPSPWWPAWDSSERVLSGPRLGTHSSPPEITLRQPLVAPRRRGARASAGRAAESLVWKQRTPGWIDSPGFRKDLDTFEGLVIKILEHAPARRAKQLPPRPGYVPAKCPRCGKALPKDPVRMAKERRPAPLSLQEKLAEHSACIALLLLQTRWIHEVNQRQNGLHEIAVGSPLRVRGRLRQPTLPGPALLRSNVSTARKVRDDAQGRYRSLEKRFKRGEQIPFQAQAQAGWDLTVARLEPQRANQELNSSRSELPDPPKKHEGKVKHGAILGILHELHADYGLPDITISRLLAAAQLPVLSARNIKRIRLTFRRP